MSQIDDDKRRVLPIWLQSQKSVALPEMKSIKPKKELEFAGGNTDALLEEFNVNPSVGVAADLVNTAIVEGDSREFGDAITLLKDADNIPIILKNMLSRLQVSANPSILERSVRELRGRLRINANDPLAWMDLARAQTIAGNENAATRAVETALYFGVDHRWIVRVAARYFVHIGQPDRALTILLRNPNVKTDPWLAAAEIAVSDVNGNPPKNWKAVNELATSNIRPVHLSELESAMATVELGSGAVKRAKKLFLSSLREPNGNAIAQAQWVERNSSISGLVSAEIKSNYDAFEALCWDAYYHQKDIQAALQLAIKWMEAEPYSRRPGEMVTFLAAILDDYETIKTYSIVSMRANPNDPLLELNAIFGRLSSFSPKDYSRSDLDQLSRDKRYLIRMSLKEGRDAFHALANLGLAEYRFGNAEQGRQYYDLASNKLSEMNEHGAMINCVIYHCREALIAESPWAVLLLNKLKDYSKRYSKHWSPGAEFYLHKLEKIESDPLNWKNILKMLPEKSDLPRREDASTFPKFEVTEKKAIIILPSKSKK